ncbi:hypothetical protein BKA70DRAFT_198358 [Coprinopsis sp. MPI-PUGE-AT-0042]|nr:hypothetical protein BKA70DRAFT_198358 [Coprinopsis sp. MPI-PUGE-AT-0042]
MASTSRLRLPAQPFQSLLVPYQGPTPPLPQSTPVLQPPPLNDGLCSRLHDILSHSSSPPPQSSASIAAARAGSRQTSSIQSNTPSRSGVPLSTSPIPRTSSASEAAWVSHEPAVLVRQHGVSYEPAVLVRQHGVSHEPAVLVRQHGVSHEPAVLVRQQGPWNGVNGNTSYWQRGRGARHTARKPKHRQNIFAMMCGHVIYSTHQAIRVPGSKMSLRKSLYKT